MGSFVKSGFFREFMGSFVESGFFRGLIIFNVELRTDKYATRLVMQTDAQDVFTGEYFKCQ